MFVSTNALSFMPVVPRAGDRPAKIEAGIQQLEGLLVRSLVHAARLLGTTPNRALGHAWSLPALCRLKIVAEDTAFFREVLYEFSRHDFAKYLEMILVLNKHSARDVLPKVRVPTLITAGLRPPTSLALLHRLQECGWQVRTEALLPQEAAAEISRVYAIRESV